MAQPTYKITDPAALEKACPQAYIVTKTLNRPALTKLWNAASDLGMKIPGVEAVEIDKELEKATLDGNGNPAKVEDPEEALRDVPAGMRGGKHAA